ncbi:zinc finger MYND domain-containing protein 15-like [Mytilus californianus]|uniref:zinc finger MYND domain-containing protein 15-like n=1 Tax=Mytilus californianus TaxID=6549 RepID=UPI00224665F5|nr:zinc finger MYND domain-containing protein 15-like [Mytilus californianus]
MDLTDRKTAEKFMGEYLQFAEKMRPDIAMIEDPEKREDELCKWLEGMEEPEKLLFDFFETNPMSVNDWTTKRKENEQNALTKIDEVKKLPVQDTIWMIDEYTSLKDDDGQNHRILSVMDTKNLYIGTLMANILELSLVQQCRDLICICALTPLTGKPRRPKSVTFKDPSYAEKAAGLDLSDLGIKYMYDGMPKENEPVKMRTCSVCRLRGTKELFKKCSSCQALLYCSKDCQKKDWTRKGDMGPHSHKIWCKRMKMYMSKTEEMRQFPFTYAQETTSEYFDMAAYKTFLEKQGVLDQGLWRRECRLHGDETKCFCSVPFGELPESEDPIFLPVESSILDEAPEKEIKLLHDWESYYEYRGFRLDSPIAILLHWPMTLYHIIKFCYPNDNPEWWDSVDSSCLKLDLIGVEKEVEMLCLFKELGYLCPDISIDIIMYGVEISKDVHNRTYEHNNVKIQIVKGPYHKRADEHRKPHLVVGLNAGLGAYQMWGQTLVKLRTDRTPAYFTDYCQYSCECARTAVEGLTFGTISDPVVNPFRNPVRKLAEENDMPWYSNGFLYRIIYPSK